MFKAALIAGYVAAVNLQATQEWGAVAVEYVKDNDMDSDEKLTVEEVSEEYKKYFETVDANNNGTVNAKEIRRWLKECTKKGTCPEVTGEQVEASDSDKPEEQVEASESE